MIHPGRHTSVHFASYRKITIAVFTALCAVVGIVWYVFASPVSAAPSTMNFQGRLLDATGTPVADGLYNMKFALYDASTSGTQLWTETRENTGTDYRVQVTNGLFTTKLGERTALTPSLFSSNSVYFEITQATPATATCSTAACATWESPMTPRHQLSTSAYAYNADTLDGLDSTAFAAATGSTNYIQNSTSPQTASFNVTGTGTANVLTASTSLSTPIIRPVADGVSALRIQDAGGSTNLLTVDSQNKAVDLVGVAMAQTSSANSWISGKAAGGRLAWRAITSSTDGIKLSAIDAGTGYIYTSTDSGATWVRRPSAGVHNWTSITSSADGTKLAASVWNGYIYTSTDSGVTWTERTSSGSRHWQTISSSADGTKLVATDPISGYIYTSTDSGATWTERTSASSKYWLQIASSADGTKLATTDFASGYIYTSTDSGAT